jgi:acetate CoA/acetoacetate CoA-transferase beta subunit
MMEAATLIAMRIARELREGMLVNLGIGIPTLVANHVPPAMHVFFQSENGLIGTGPVPEQGLVQSRLTDAGGRPVSAIPGASTFDSAMSFGLIRGGHVDLTVLGALQVDRRGLLANWMIPGKMVPGMGGAMDLVTGAKRVIVAMQHTAKGQSKVVRDTERSLEASYQQALRGIETLVGRYPAASIVAPPRLARWPGDVPVGLPSELMERRPDIVAAERRVAGAFYRTEEAKAARLPRISLTASITSISSELFVLQNHDNPVVSLGAQLLQPIFLGGQLQAQVDVRTAEQKQAIAEYARIGTRAFAEVEDALSNGFALAERETILAIAVRENARVLELAGVRFRVGSGDLRGVQQQQLALFRAGRALTRAGRAARAASQPASRAGRKLRYASATGARQSPVGRQTAPSAVQRRQCRADRLAPSRAC